MAKARLVDVVKDASGTIIVTVQFPKTIVVTQQFVVPPGTAATRPAIIAALTPLILAESQAELTLRATGAPLLTSTVEFDI